MSNKILVLRRRILRLLPEWIWPVSVMLDGVSIPLRGRPWSYGTKWLIKKGGYEAEERFLLKGILIPGMQVIEMGSSIGVLSAIIAEKIGASGRLLAVEASSALTKYSAPWLAKYPWVKVINGFGFPVWEAGTLTINGFNEDRGSLGGVVSFATDADATAGAPSEEVWDIKTITQKHNLQADILVIDVEGSEHIMLKRSPQFPASIQYILIELHPGFYPGGTEDSAAIITTIREEGFTLLQSMNGVYLFKR